MKIRPVLKEDDHQLAILQGLCFDHERWSLDQIRGSLALPTTYGWEVVEEGQILGYVLVQRAMDESEILTIAVHPDFQKRGYGEALVRAVLKTSGAGTVFLEVAADNVAAKKLYEKCGFSLFATRPAYYKRRGGAVDALAYRYVAKG